MLKLLDVVVGVLWMCACWSYTIGIRVCLSGDRRESDPKWVTNVSMLLAAGWRHSARAMAVVAKAVGVGAMLRDCPTDTLGTISFKLE